MTFSRCCLLLFTFLSTTTLFVLAISTSDYCIFEDKLKELFRNLNCHNSDLDHCSTNARRIAQENLSGSWGTILVDKQMILDDKIDWYIHTIYPQPSRCRLIIKETIVLEVFRTGYRPMNPYTQQWMWSDINRLLADPRDLDICPHSTLRGLVAGYMHPNVRRRTGSKIHTLAKSLALAFHTETNHNWNVFVTRGVGHNSTGIGLNLPRYVYDARSGICVGQTSDGYNINASIVGFEDQHEEATSNADQKHNVFMWLVIAAFVLPAAIFSFCGFLAWMRMWAVGRRREQKVFDQLEQQVRQRIEDHRRSVVDEMSSGYSRRYSTPMITIEEPEVCVEQPTSVLFV